MLHKGTLRTLVVATCSKSWQPMLVFCSQPELNLEFTWASLLHAT